MSWTIPGITAGPHNTPTSKAMTTSLSAASGPHSRVRERDAVRAWVCPARASTPCAASVHAWWWHRGRACRCRSRVAARRSPSPSLDQHPDRSSRPRSPNRSLSPMRAPGRRWLPCRSRPTWPRLPRPGSANVPASNPSRPALWPSSSGRTTRPALAIAESERSAAKTDTPAPPAEHGRGRPTSRRCRAVARSCRYSVGLTMIFRPLRATRSSKALAASLSG